MLSRNAILILLSGFLFSSSTILADDPPLPPWYPLKSWEISGFRAYNPRDGPYGANATGLELTIANPSWIPAAPAPHASGGGYIAFEESSANCTVHWKVDSETPYGHIKDAPCVAEPTGSTQAEWNITINEIQDNPVHYISLSFSLALRLHAYGSEFYKMMTAPVYLQVGEKLDGGCDEDGSCSYTLTNGSEPLLVQPTLQECKSACG